MAERTAGGRRRIRFALVCEEIRSAPAEGALRFLWHLAAAAAERFDTRVYHARGDLPTGLDGERLSFRKLGVSRALGGRLDGFRPELVLYAPSASLTFNALIRSASLRRRCPVPQALLALQERPVNLAIRLLAPTLRRSRVWVLSQRMGESLRKAGFLVGVASGGVDLERFRRVDPEQRARLRRQLGWPSDLPVVLHVGHVTTGRGLELLMDLAATRRYHVIMVASPMMESSARLQSQLERAGVRLWREYLPAIEQVYQAASAYLFPVQQSDASIEFPLSVLEAAACGLPVAATRFGSLPEHFSDQPGFRYLGSGDSVADRIGQLIQEGPIDPAKLREFGWDRVCTRILDQLESELA